MVIIFVHICSKIHVVKNIIKILFIFFSFLFLQGINQSSTSYFVVSDFIQSSSQKVVLTSQNLSENVIIKNKSDSSSDITTSENVGAIPNGKSNLLVSYNPHISRGIIHNISTNSKTEISIRAP